MSAETTLLFRPVGPQELELIRATGFRRFPPRLPEQPIFYPVLNSAYAEQIARDWNSRSDSTGRVGYVTQFAVATTFLARYAPQQVGAAEHVEYWVPAEELNDFNRHIVGAIEVVAEFRDGKPVQR